MSEFLQIKREGIFKWKVENECKLPFNIPSSKNIYIISNTLKKTIGRKKSYE